jgi:hypothetical protein
LKVRILPRLPGFIVAGRVRPAPTGFGRIVQRIRIERYERSDWGSSPHAPTSFTARRPIGEDTVLRRLGSAFESPRAGQVTGRVGRLDMHSAVYRDEAGSIPVLSAMRSNSTGEQRLVFQASIGGFDSHWPYQDRVSSGSVAKTGKHRSLKPDMREFDSPRTHQVIRL